MDANSEKANYVREFLEFLNESPTHFHAGSTAKLRLVTSGFIELSETDVWKLIPGGKYFYIRNNSTVIAFTVGGSYIPGNGYTILGAHTDSPCLKIKPVTCIVKSNNLMLNTQPYGGGLWHTWFDRDLGIAGRVILRNASGNIESRNVTIDKPIARIPNLAIHLTSGKEREAFEPNLQEHAKAIISCDPDILNFASEKTISNSRFHPYFLHLIAQAAHVDESEILDMELQLMDCQKSSLGGIQEEFIYSGRLDNLCSSYQCLRALIDSSNSSEVIANQTNICMVALFDHEEIGSNSYNGAGSSIFMDTLTLINEALTNGSSSILIRSLRKSFLVSADMAHGLHPNYSSKHDFSMAPVFNKGMVIKHNANQKYATNSISACLFREAGKLAGVPMQEFTVRSDSGCGSTIGPILSTLSGILTVDCGTPQYSMHSIREMMATADAYTGYLHLKAVLVHHSTLATTFATVN